MSSAVYSSSASLEHAPVDAAKAVSGAPTTGFLALGSSETLNFGLWEHSAAISTDTEVEEIFVILAGKGRIHLADGTVLELAPGTVGTLKKGEETRWEIDEPLKKVWIMPK